MPKAERAEFKGVTKKTIRDPVQKLVLIVPVEEQDGDVYGPNPSNAEDQSSKGRKRVTITQGRLPPSGAEGDYKKKGPGILVHSTKVFEMTMLDASVTYNQSDSLTKTYDAGWPDQSLQLQLRGEGYLMCVTTQYHKNVDLKPATASLDIETLCLEHETANLVHDASSGLICSLFSDKSLCLSCPSYDECTRARLQPGLTKVGRSRLIAEILHVHQDEVRAYSPADAQTQFRHF